MEIYLWFKVLFSGYYYYLRNILWGGGEKNYMYEIIFCLKINWWLQLVDSYHNEKIMWQIIIIIGLVPSNN